MKITFCLSIFIFFSFASIAQNASDYNKAMAKTVMTIWKDSLTNGNAKPAKWSYDRGVILKGIEGLWKFTGEGKYFDYMQKSMDLFIDDQGDINTYKFKDFTLDNILC